MNISISLQVSHYLALQASSLARMYRGIVGTRSRSWLTESHHIRPNLFRRGVQLSVLVIVAAVITGLAQADIPNAGVMSAMETKYVLGEPCTTLTDFKEGTCNLQVDKIKKNAGQPKPFTNNWRN